MKAAHASLALALLSASTLALSAGASSANELAHCAGIAAPDDRLACYDKLAGRAPEPAATSAAGKVDSTAVGMPAAASAADRDPANFGLSQVQIHKTPVGPESIQARVVRLSEGQFGARGQVVLDNGQTWSFTDAEQDRRLRPGDLVTIKRAALGSFMLTTASKRSYHVRRAQ